MAAGRQEAQEVGLLGLLGFTMSGQLDDVPDINLGLDVLPTVLDDGICGIRKCDMSVTV